MKKIFLSFLFLTQLIVIHAEYSIEKLENDLCTTTSFEGRAKIYATGHSGPYTILDKLDNEVGLIPLGQDQTIINNLKWGTHTFTIANAYGCKYDVIVKILRVNCGNCPTNPDRTLSSYLFTNSPTINGLRNTELKKLKTHFTSNFIVDSDIPQGKICIKDLCSTRTTTVKGSVSYSSILELGKRLKSSLNKLVVELEDQRGNLKVGTLNSSTGQLTFEELATGNYKLNVKLITASNNITIASHQIVINRKTCAPKYLVQTNPSSPSASTLENDTWQANEVTTSSINNNGLTTNSTLDLSVYPNPFNSDINITVEASLVNAKLSILNALGQEVVVVLPQQEIGNKSVNVSLAHLAVGVYKVALIKDDLTIISKRIVKVQK